MSLKLSIKDIRFMKPLLFFTTCLLITPKCIFTTPCEIKQTPLFKTYGIVTISLKVLLRTYFIISDWGDVGTDISYSLFFLHSLSNVTLICLSVIIILKASFFGKDDWQFLLESLSHIDYTLGNRNEKQSNILKNFYFSYFIRQLFTMVLMCFGFIAVVKYVGTLSFFFYFMLCCFDIYINFLIIILANALSHSFLSRYRDLNKALQQCQNFKCEPSAIRIRTIRKLGELYRILGETVQVFSNMFGYQILLIMLNFALQMISAMAFTLNVVKNSNQNSLKGGGVITANLSLVLYSLVSVFQHYNLLLIIRL